MARLYPFSSILSIVKAQCQEWIHSFHYHFIETWQQSVSPEFLVRHPGYPRYRVRHFLSNKAYVVEAILIGTTGTSVRTFNLIRPYFVSNLPTDGPEVEDLRADLESRWPYQDELQPRNPGSPLVGERYSFHLGIFYQPNGFTSNVGPNFGPLQFDWGKCRLTNEYYYDEERSLIVIKVIAMQLVNYAKPILRGVLVIPLFASNVPHIIPPNELATYRENARNRPGFPSKKAIAWQEEFIEGCRVQAANSIYGGNTSAEEQTRRNFLMPSLRMPKQAKLAPGN
jgi:hypothetical protein